VSSGLDDVSSGLDDVSSGLDVAWIVDELGRVVVDLDFDRLLTFTKDLVDFFTNNGILALINIL
jgi:hypothetical protein